MSGLRFFLLLGLSLALCSSRNGGGKEGKHKLSQSGDIVNGVASWPYFNEQFYLTVRFIYEIPFVIKKPPVILTYKQCNTTALQRAQLKWQFWNMRPGHFCFIQQSCRMGTRRIVGKIHPPLTETNSSRLVFQVCVFEWGNMLSMCFGFFKIKNCCVSLLWRSSPEYDKK